MDRNHRSSNWRLSAILGLVVWLVVISVHPASAHISPMAAFVFLPIFLFGLILVPRSFWPSSDLGQQVPARSPYRRIRFQRPPPSCKN
jgi:hypothetical protein